MMDQATFNALADLALTTSGQLIKSSDIYAVKSRLAPILRREGFGSYADLVHCINERGNAVLIEEVAATMVSKHSYFFRERRALFQLVEDIVPVQLKASNAGRLKVWIAGGGAGFEAYSLAILMQEKANRLGGAQINILSTDICKNQTALGREGAFGHFEVQKGLSIHRLLAHFRQLDTGQWQISADMRERISFRDHNLMQNADSMGKHDIIICRNVLSGMSKSAQSRVVSQLNEQLLPSGVLLIGETEELVGVSDCVERSADFDGAWVTAGTANERAA